MCCWRLFFFKEFVAVTSVYVPFWRVPIENNLLITETGNWHNTDRASLTIVSWHSKYIVNLVGSVFIFYFDVLQINKLSAHQICFNIFNLQVVVLWRSRPSVRRTSGTIPIVLLSIFDYYFHIDLEQANRFTQFLLYLRMCGGLRWICVGLSSVLAATSLSFQLQQQKQLIGAHFMYARAQNLKHGLLLSIAHVLLKENLYGAQHSVCEYC